MIWFVGQKTTQLPYATGWLKTAYLNALKTPRLEILYLYYNPMNCNCQFIRNLDVIGNLEAIMDLVLIRYTGPFLPGIFLSMI